jgi:MoCo/4Fe-4S cofactor protein with predicted Tat translocation signal
MTASRKTSTMSADDKTVHLASIHGALAGKTGRRYWQTLDELADTEEFRALVRREFPAQASEWFDPVGRRSFLKLMGASIALAGATACTRQPDELIVPYVRQPEDIVPGRPLFFATTMTLAGIGTGLLAESHEGRPTKLEGNPDHPSSLGATDLFGQASVLTMYDPDRMRSLTYLGEIRPWSRFMQAMQSQLNELRASGGAGLRFLSGTIGSPTLGAQFQEILTALPAAKWHQYEPASRENVYTGGTHAFGSPVDVHYRLDQAAVIVALDADLLGSVAGGVRYSRDFANGRRVRRAKAEMNRLYVAEPTPTPTGSVADHRLPLRASQVEGATRALLAAVQGGAPSTGNADLDKFLAAAAKDLTASRGRGVVVVGDRQPPAVHAVTHRLNQLLGNIGTTVILTDPIVPNAAPQTESLATLVRDMNAGAVKLLVILDSNPVFTAPADLKFADALKKVAARVNVGLFDDETAELCHWQVPSTHFLEEWSDARAHDGTASLVQPLIAPLYQGKSLHEVMAVFGPQPDRAGLDIVKAYWQSQPQAADQAFDKFWRRSLHDGVIAGGALPPKTVGDAQVPAPSAPAAAARGYEVMFAPDPTLYDGRFANNGWLQELPKPLTKITWDNAVLVAPATAQKLQVVNGDVVSITVNNRTLEAPIWIQPGHAADALTVYFGNGRRRGGHIIQQEDGIPVGYNGYLIRTSDAPGFVLGADVRKTGETVLIAATQGHHSMEGRTIVRSGTLEHYKHDPEFPHKMEEAPSRSLSLYSEHKYEGHAWGMAIDQTVCTGCSACVVACVAENNIAVIGKEQVLRSREMHWIRIDRYFEGDPDRPAIHHQPMLCQQCENAPCEVVCPVAATTHSSEGLNDMVYNRCVGTRYCSHNCPYKVRRFNFLLYSDWVTPSYKLQRNPDVTVRSRGVMEKCTYCVQRINLARQDAKVEDRQIRDGDIVTACQQACPTEAIVFGDINDPESRVSKLKAEAHNYGVLAELNTRPRTTYLAEITNPNPELGPEVPEHEEKERALPKAPPTDTSETNSMTHAPR